jgi:hypothetical protein
MMNTMRTGIFAALLRDHPAAAAKGAHRRPPAVVAPAGADLYSVRASVNVIAPGGSLTVSWTATRGGRDTIALYKKGDPNTAAGWWRETFGALAGTFTLTAPSHEGQYEFRYLLDDEVTDTARSSLVTVTSQ